MAAAIDDEFGRIAPERVGRIEIIDEGSDPRDHNRSSAGHCLEHAEAKALLDRSEDKRGGQPIESWHVGIGDRAEQRNRRGPFPQCGQFPAESGLIGMMIEQARAPCDDEARVGPGAMNFDEGLKNAGRVFARLDAADRQKHRA